MHIRNPTKVMCGVKERQRLPSANKVSQKTQGKNAARMWETLCFYHGFQHGSERSELKDSWGFTSVTALSSTFVFPLTSTFEIVMESVWTQGTVDDRT